MVADRWTPWGSFKGLIRAGEVDNLKGVAKIVVPAAVKVAIQVKKDVSQIINIVRRGALL